MEEASAGRHKTTEGLEPPRPCHTAPQPQVPEPLADREGSGVPAPAATAADTAPTWNSKQPELNFGTIVFTLFAALSLIVCLARGVVLIYIAESALWAGLAWYWQKKHLVSPKINIAVLLIAILVASGEGFTEGLHWSSHRTSDLGVASAANQVPSPAPLATNENDSQSLRIEVPSKCPTALPAGASIGSLAPDVMKTVAGISGKVTASPWRTDISDGRPIAVLQVRNDSNFCLTKIEVELAVSREGVVTKERQQVAFAWPLSPGESSNAQTGYLRAAKRITANFPELVEWHISQAWGFELPK